MLKKNISITHAPVRAHGAPCGRQQNTQTMPDRNLELLKTNLALWQELTDEAFERHFRQRYFGNESISRQQAIDRLVSSGFEHLHTGSFAEPAATESRLREAVSGFPQWGPAYFTASPISIQLPMLPSGRPRWPSMLLSLLTHGLILSLLLSVRISQRRNRLIDFDTETITYYKMSDSFPNVAPNQRKELPESSPAPNPRPMDFQSDLEAQVRPTESQHNEIVIEQPNVRQMSALPKLQLPNILLHTSKMDPGRAPLVVPAEVLQHLQLEVQPQSLGILPQNSAETLTTRHPTLPLPQLAEPAEPASVVLSVTPPGAPLARLEQQAASLPYAAPPVDDSPVGFQVEGIAGQGTDLLVFSASPAIHKGEIRIPKASSEGRLTASSTETPPSVLAPDVVELGRAEIVVPSISIINRTAPTVATYGTTLVQAPPPKPPVLPKPPSPPRASSLLDFLPSRIPSTKPLVPSNSDIGPGESPLRDYEGRGGPVYTAAINAPNFTSKRGSWIFRFAELSAAEPASLATAPASPLTAPSAIVKVDPRYAPEVVRERLEGVVILFAILRKDGSIDGESVRVVRKLDSRLDLSARDALLNWKFKPSQKNGVAVDIQMEVSIPFYFRKDGL